MGKENSNLGRFRTLFSDFVEAQGGEWNPEQEPLVIFEISHNHLIEYGVDPEKLAEEMEGEICSLCQKGIRDEDGVCTVCDNTGVIPENIQAVIDSLPGKYIRIMRPPREGDEWRDD